MKRKTIIASAVTAAIAGSAISSAQAETFSTFACKQGLPMILRSINAKVGSRAHAVEGYCHPLGANVARYRINLVQHSRIIFWEVVEARVANGKEHSFLIGDYGIPAARRLLEELGLVH